MLNYFKKENSLVFLGGALTGAIALQFIKSKTFHKFAVNTVAQGIFMKDNLAEEYTNIKEEAEDICSEARDIAIQKQSNFIDADDIMDIEE